ncbi:MAG: helix-turn-helix domain-containing protein [Pseudomonadota bacterium]
MEENLYPYKEAAKAVAHALDISPEEICRFAGLDLNSSDERAEYVTVRQFFDVWRGAEAAYRRDDIGFRVGTAFAKAPPSPVFISLMSAPNYAVGMRRLEDFKSLFSPVVASTSTTRHGFEVKYRSLDPHVEIPTQVGLAHIVSSVNFISNFTASKIVPVSVSLTDGTPVSDALRGLLGEHIRLGSDTNPTITYSRRDSEKPFLTASAKLWTKIEGQLQADMEFFHSKNTTTARVRKLLQQSAPAGGITFKQIQDHIGMSQSTLQRKLRNEGTNFQNLVDRTKTELASFYLQNPRISLSEISLLVGFSDPNSFIRSFKRLTGQTPGQYRRDIVKQP